MKPYIQINPADNVAVALSKLEAHTAIQIPSQPPISFELPRAIDKGHKFALTQIDAGSTVVKYGAVIGEAIEPIEKGAYVNELNLKTRLESLQNYEYQPELPSPEQSPAQTINIYRRASGEIGIRNELWVIPTVSCVNGIANNIVRAFYRENPCTDIDGVFVFPHQFGCSQLGDDLASTQKILQRMIEHPNAGGVLVLGLGCESNQMALLKQGINNIDPQRQKFIVTQEVEDELEAGVAALDEIYQVMRHDRRQQGTLSELVVGLECGGSDGLSGITANPLLGVFSDQLIAQGGSTVLTEVPEMFGAEHLLMARCKSSEVFHELVNMINNFKNYYKDHNQPIYENPSPGNKAGGISTLEEKSLGCTQKAGSAIVEAIVGYGEKIKHKGLNLLNAPGNDAIATSALGAAGCHLVLFTTGRGTPYGGFIPTLKIATNTELAERKKHWIDFNAGELIEGKTMEVVSQEFMEKIIAIVNGEASKNELNDIRELAIWKNGVTL